MGDQNRPKNYSAHNDAQCTAAGVTLFTSLHKEPNTRPRPNSLSPESSDHFGLTVSHPDNARMLSYRRVSALLPHPPPPSPRKTVQQLWELEKQRQGCDNPVSGRASVPLRRLGPGMEHSGMLQRLPATDEGDPLLLPSLPHPATPASTPATHTAPVGNPDSKQWHELSASTHFDVSLKQQVGLVWRRGGKGA